MCAEIMPSMGLGTYGLNGADGTRAVLNAIEIGYRHLDTAQAYHNEDAVGAAATSCGLDRTDLFVTTKVDPGNFRRFVPSVEESLKTLGLDYVDLLLIHWPSNDMALSAYVPELVRAKQLGLTRHIGVSNFPVALIDETVTLLGDEKLLTNQVEIHPYLQNRKLAGHCAKLGIRMTAYQPLAKATVANDPVLQEIGKRHNASATQISLAFLLQNGFIPIPKTAHPQRMQSNFDAAKIRLSAEDMTAIEKLDRNGRRIAPESGPDWD